MRNDEFKDLDDLIETARREHRTPPPAPREALWERIDATRAPQRRIVRTDFRRHLRWAAAAAAMLAAGVLLGRLAPDPATPGAGPQQVVVAPEAASGERAAEAGNPLYDRVAVAVLDRADALLTDFRVRSCAEDETRTEVKSWAGSLLSETRLLMNTPAGDDPELGRLLSELELVLAQLSMLSDDRCETDSAWIVDGMKRRDTLERLRAEASVRRDRIAL